MNMLHVMVVAIASVLAAEEGHAYYIFTCPPAVVPCGDTSDRVIISNKDNSITYSVYDPNAEDWSSSQPAQGVSSSHHAKQESAQQWTGGQASGGEAQQWTGGQASGGGQPQWTGGQASGGEAQQWTGGQAWGGGQPQWTGGQASGGEAQQWTGGQAWGGQPGGAGLSYGTVVDVMDHNTSAAILGPSAAGAAATGAATGATTGATTGAATGASQGQAGQPGSGKPGQANTGKSGEKNKDSKKSSEKKSKSRSSSNDDEDNGVPQASIFLALAAGAISMFLV